MRKGTGTFQARWTRRGAWRIAVALLLPCSIVATAQQDPPPTPATEEATPTDALEPVHEDSAAIIYMKKCMGCHTIGGGALSGPDLKNAVTYPRQTVWDGIKRMEKNVGPLAHDEIEQLAELILSPEAGARVEAQRELVQLRELASLEPANAEKGRALYFGYTAFRNGAVSCSACHQAEGRGGNLAASLEDAFTRLGEQPLLSTTEAPGFPVMRAVYAPHPVTKQEALHVVKFLEGVSESPAPTGGVPLHLAGLAGTVLTMAALGRGTRKRAAGTRARMVAEANRRENLGGARGGDNT